MLLISTKAKQVRSGKEMAPPVFLFEQEVDVFWPHPPSSSVSEVFVLVLFAFSLGDGDGDAEEELEVRV